MLNKDDYNISIVDILVFELNYTKEEAEKIAADNDLR